MLIAAPPPAPLPIVIPDLLQLRPLSFIGFQARMPLADATALSTSNGGTLSCRGTSDDRIRECNGAMPYPGMDQSFAVLISAVHDSAAVIVLTANVGEDETRDWARTLTYYFGTPNYRKDPGQRESWQWIRKGQMLRLLMQRDGSRLESSVTLTDGPLLDGLGPPQRKRAGRDVRLR